MAEKIGAGGELQEYDIEDGEYEETDGVKEKDKSKVEAYDSRNRLKNLKPYVSPKVDIIKIKIYEDKDSILPNLHKEALEKIGLKENKKVLLKQSIVKRNLKEHSDISINDMESIVANTLYSFDDIIPGRNQTNNYFSFIKVMRLSKKDGKPVYGVCLLDVSVNNKYFEIVHCHWVKEKNIKSLK